MRVLLRRPVEVPPGAASAVVGDLTRPINMAAALSDVDAVVHSAGLAHAMSGAPEDDYRTLNTQATARLAEAAAKARVRRFVFLSSIRAQTGPSAPSPVTEADEPRPTDPYGRSKREAELALAATGLDWAACGRCWSTGPARRATSKRCCGSPAPPRPCPSGACAGDAR